MRKSVLFVAAALTVVFAAAAPVLAQETVGGDMRAVDCSRIQGAAARSSAQDVKSAVAPGTAAAIAQELGASRERVDACLKTGVRLVGVGSGNDAGATASSSATAEADGALPETGGVSLIGLGVGALLVAGGQLLRRIVR